MIENATLKLLEVREKLLERFVQREQVIDCVLAGLVSGEPVILVGPPGTAKTAIIEALSRMVDARYFYYLLTKFTEPDEILGPLDINALRRGEYKRITSGRLPEAEIVFLDEVFKASSAIRNVLLDIILHKRVIVGAEYKSIPMLALYTASNEVTTDAEDAGFYDRLTIRVFHDFVTMDAWERLLMRGLELLEGEVPKGIISAQEVRLLQKEAIKRALNLRYNKELIGKFLETLTELSHRGVHLTDRRKVKTLVIASAFSVIFAEDTVTPDSLADAIKATAPSHPDDVAKIEEVLAKVGLSSYTYTIRQLQTVAAELRNLIDRARTIPCPTNIRALQSALSKAIMIVERAGDSARLRPHVNEALRECEKAQRLLERINDEKAGD